MADVVQEPTEYDEVDVIPLERILHKVIYINNMEYEHTEVLRNGVQQKTKANLIVPLVFCKPSDSWELNDMLEVM